MTAVRNRIRGTCESRLVDSQSVRDGEGREANRQIYSSGIVSYEYKRAYKRSKTTASTKERNSKKKNETTIDKEGEKKVSANGKRSHWRPRNTRSSRKPYANYFRCREGYIVA